MMGTDDILHIKYMIIGYMVKLVIWSKLLWSYLGSYIIKVFGYMVNLLFGQFLLDKTVDHISDMQCNP